MATLKFLINISLIFTATATLYDQNSSNDLIPVQEDSSNDSVINYRLPANVVPVHYNIKLIPYIVEDNFTFEGESNVNITIRHVTQTLSLHVLELTINETETSLFDNNGIIYTPAMYNYDNITQILVLNFNDELSPGNYILKMRYVGILHNDLKGFFISSYINEEGNDVWFAATYFEQTFARRAFPCWDEPALKATFDISIKHHRNYTVLSNMPIRKQLDGGNKDGIIWTHFDTTPIISTYLVAFVVADFVRVPTEDETINLWCRSKLVPDTKLAQEVVQKSKTLLTEYTNSTSKVPKMDLVALPRFTVGAMENWGLIIVVETYFAYNESVNTIHGKLVVAMTTTHEMAHQWLSNVVTPLWWSQTWLSEGFATFFQMYILNQMFEDLRIMEYFVVGIQQTILHKDINMSMTPITLDVSSPEEIKSLFLDSSYGKAPAIMRMLQHIITDEVFRNGLIKYLRTHQFSSATSDDLWNALQAVLDTSDVPHDAYRLKEIMDTWIKQSDFPVVHVTRKKDTNEIILTQEYFVLKNENENVNDNKWWIPLTFATQTNPDFSNTLPTHWLKPQDRYITIDGIDPNDWIIVNLQQTGYYRVNYDSSIWQKIGDYLKSDNYTKIHVLNRAQIIDDAYHFMMLNKHDIMMFLNIISYLSQEIDFIPWYSMFKILTLTEDIYKVPENEILKLYMLKLLEGLIKNVGYEEDPTENDLIKLKRIGALKWACTFGHSECKKMATVKLNEYFADPTTHKVSPNLKKWMYCNGFMEANASILNKLYDKFVNKPDEEVLMFLICSDNTDIIINFLNISISNNLTKIDAYYIIYSSIIKKHAKNNIVIDYILTNFKELFPRSKDANSALNDIIDNVYFKEKLDEINEFVKNEFEEKIFKDVQDKIIGRKELLDTLVSFQPPNIKEKLKL
ncbi:aminopeptidase N [Camponotus floridanus]|uniref:aminopeptidase N n=1 Tax=Camponotus floridanus TaxID=104421 RepID=UPI000DC6BF53|nr:aminopeptidase N [Camponotus floridanus]XP_025268279.1 aminopeptidase N [Camponotus floridanus]